MTTRKIDAVICDAGTIHVDGYHLCYKVRRNAKLKNTPIILCSTESNATKAQMANDMGADIFISHTTQPVAIVEHVNHIFRNPDNYVSHTTPPAMSTEAMHRFNEQLIERLEERNNELLKVTSELEKMVKILNEAQQIAHVGSWEMSLKTFEGNWTDETYRIFGTTAEDTPASFESFLSFIHPDDREGIIASIKTSLALNKDINFKCRIIRKDGAIRFIYTYAGYRFDDTGKAISTYGITHDITEKEIAEQEVLELNANLEERVKQRTEALVDANVQLESFAYMVSHDLRSPLRNITGFIQILQKNNSCQLDKDGNELLVAVGECAAKMQNLITDLLNFSRLGKNGINPVEVDLEAMINSNWSALTLSLPSVPQFILNTLPHVTADKPMLTQVIVNFLSNAIKYSSHNPAPVVEVGAIEGQEQVTIYIKDNGAGFDMKNYDKLFGVFQRLHSAGEFEGTGVGLAIVKRVIDKHNGRVWAESELGKGATFYFSLPV